MNTDRELLVLAAKAADINIKMDRSDADDQFIGFIVGTRNTNQRFAWNPLTDDGDALRLAVKLGLDFYEGDDDGRAAYVGYYERRGNTKPPRFMIERHDAHADPYAATRRAIVRAAAAIGAST